MKKYIITLLLLCSSVFTWAQQDAQYTMYMFNGLSINPAYAGTKEGLSLMAIGRYQWVGLDGAPKTFAVSADGPFKDKNGLGLYAEFDQIGVHERIKTYGSYNYKLQFNDRARLSLGVQVGLLYVSSALTDVNPGVVDPTYAQDLSEMMPNFGAGLYFYTDDLYLGFSVPHILNSDYGDPTVLAKEERHYYLTGGSIIQASENLKFKPSFLIKSVPKQAPIQADINLGLIFHDFIGIGATYRTNDSLDFLAQLYLESGLKIGYSYDYTLTELTDFNTGSHEIMIGFDFGNNSVPSSKSRERIVTPRFF